MISGLRYQRKGSVLRIARPRTIPAEIMEIAERLGSMLAGGRTVRRLDDLPFPPGSFATVFRMGMLHLFDDAGPLAGLLLRLPDDRGALYLTTLVLGGR